MVEGTEAALTLDSRLAMLDLQLSIARTYSDPKKKKYGAFKYTVPFISSRIDMFKSLTWEMHLDHSLKVMIDI